MSDQDTIATLLWHVERADEGAWGLSSDELDTLEALLRRMLAPAAGEAGEA